MFKNFALQEHNSFLCCFLYDITTVFDRNWLCLLCSGLPVCPREGKCTRSCTKENLRRTTELNSVASAFNQKCFGKQAVIQGSSNSVYLHAKRIKATQVTSSPTKLV